MTSQLGEHDRLQRVQQLPLQTDMARRPAELPAAEGLALQLAKLILLAAMEEEEVEAEVVEVEVEEEEVEEEVVEEVEVEEEVEEVEAAVGLVVALVLELALI
jgi:hypothetical protein